MREMFSIDKDIGEVIRTSWVGIDLPIFLKRSTTSIYGDDGCQEGGSNQTESDPYMYAKATAESLLCEATIH